MLFSFSSRKKFSQLSAQQLLALAISAEEEDSHIYQDIAAALSNFPATAQVFQRMAEEEHGHRQRLIDLYQQKFGSHIPLIRRSDVAGFITAPTVWLQQPLNLAKIRSQAAQMEAQNSRFYALAAARSTDADIRRLLGDLALEESVHESTAENLVDALSTDTAHEEDQTAKRHFVLQVVQPGLAGLIDGSVSTLAPLFAAAMATQNSHETLMVGLAASIGAGISMGLTEGMSDDGKISGRGSPWLRGVVCGVMTAVGGIGHALPYLISNVTTATALAIAIVAIELAAITWLRHKYMETPWFGAAVQVLIGGSLVVAVGLLLGGA